MVEEKSPTEEEYELLPHKEIEDLKDELAKLKEFEIAPSKKLQLSLLELNNKLDKMVTIFEDASHEMKIEEGGLSFTDKMKPLLEKMNKILEQNSEIASGILALVSFHNAMILSGKLFAPLSFRIILSLVNSGSWLTVSIVVVTD